MPSPPVWKASGPGEVSAEYDPKTATSALSYKLTGSEVHKKQTWRYTNKEINATDVIFDWSFDGFHAYYKASIEISLELKMKNSGTRKILMKGPRRGPITGKGQEAVSLKDCTEYSFVIQGSNFDSDMRLLGTLTVKENDDEDPKWRTEGPGQVSAMYDAATDYSDLSYSLSGNEVHTLQTWKFTSAEVSDGEVTFDWDYSGFHAWYQAYIKIVLELKKESGTEEIELMEGKKRGNITGKGQIHVSLKGCKAYSFVIQGKNFDTDTRLLGTLKVKEDPRKREITWDAEGPGEVNATYNAATDISDLSYKLTGSSVHELQTWQYTNKCVDAEYMVFDWEYNGFHAWYKAYIKIEIHVAYANNDVKKIVLMEGERRGNITGKGQEYVDDLKDATSYSYVVQGKNYDADMRLLGTLKVKET